ncbi:hypothetical protein CAOG_02025 [Capsaspora owczarzaki ATCC 30864]|uniref:hypothetical protein n=1 Tax=Capsaspora owczarzaki (strain ATCC 30864) TaxID=595528 RepID=UPI00035225B3|nr:hypothetical protein CAOG_02025 [Capsaspora owczarzaki ATCC 30864]|eukprot:XP_004348775.2 hypothetical protein CAOG_02025 [Capsaspora owczarzaki ATCC 30864]
MMQSAVFYGSDQVTTVSFKVPESLSGDLVYDASRESAGRSFARYGELVQFLMIVGCPIHDIGRMPAQYEAWRAEFSTLQIDVRVQPLPPLPNGGEEDQPRPGQNAAGATITSTQALLHASGAASSLSSGQFVPDTPLATLLASPTAKIQLQPYSVSNSARRYDEADFQERAATLPDPTDARASASDDATKHHDAAATSKSRALPRDGGVRRSYSVAYGPKTQLSHSSIPLAHADNGDIIYLVSTYLGHIPQCQRIQFTINTNSVQAGSAMDLTALNLVTPNEFLEVLASRSVPNQTLNNHALRGALTSSAAGEAGGPTALSAAAMLLSRRAALVNTEQAKRPFTCTADFVLDLIPPPRVESSAARIGRSLFLSFHISNPHERERISLHGVDFSVARGGPSAVVSSGLAPVPSEDAGSTLQLWLTGDTEFPITLSPGERYTFVYRIDETVPRTTFIHSSVKSARGLLFVRWNPSTAGCTEDQVITCDYGISDLAEFANPQLTISSCVVSEGTELQASSDGTTFVQRASVGVICVQYTVGNLSLQSTEATLLLGGSDAHSKEEVAVLQGSEVSSAQLECLTPRIRLGPLATGASLVVTGQYIARSAGVVTIPLPRVFNQQLQQYASISGSDLIVAVS